MKQVFLVLFLSLFSIQLGAQELKVESFKILENDMDARTNYPKEDLNGKKAAIIKVVTSETGFTFDTGTTGIVDTPEQKMGEIWVYVPAKVKKITIKHQNHGVLRNYPFSIPIKEATVYEMRLTTSKIRTIVEEDAGGQYWILNVNPKNAEVTIDNGTPEVLNDGVLQKLLPYGKHTYTVNAPLYETTGGEITISKERVVTDVELTPSFGYLDITSEPVVADVYLNGEKVGKTPFITQRLPKGTAKIRLVSGLYQPIEREVDVPGKGDTLTCPIVMSPNFAEVEFVTEQDASIYVNDKRMANGSWKDKLVEGLYKVEARKQGYRTIMKSIKVVKGQNQKIEFDKLTPVYGKVDISTGSLANVKVLIDGKDMGIAPNIFSEILIGKHVITLIKEGYKTYRTELNVEEGKLHNIKVELEKELWGDLLVTSSPGATVIVNGIKSLNQYSGKVKAGVCKVTIVYDNYNQTEDVKIIAGQRNEYHYPLEGNLQITSSPSKARVRVDGFDKGTTPVVLNLYGQHEISVFKGNKYRYTREDVYVSPMGNSSKHFSLKRIPNDLYTFWLYTASPTANYGGMVGICRTFGWYGKAQIGLSDYKKDVDWNFDYSQIPYNTWKKQDRYRMSITSGPMLRVAKWLYLYAGAGYGDYGRIYSGIAGHYDYEYSYFCPLRCKGLEAEGGAIFKAGGVVLSCGYSTIFSNVPAGEKRFGDLHVGIGFTINHSK